jgi:predicted transcriptional regulator
LKDVDSGKFSVQTTKENKAEMKNHELNCMNVENMMEELHKTGQVSAFINNVIDSNHCKMKSTSEVRLLQL